jgi:S-adenosylmethionine:tRNA ribosyltransferase-isomerase
VCSTTGVASLEADEQPYPEHATLPRATAARVNATRAAGGRVVAIGTTVVRALESAVDPLGRVHAFDGWTDLVITPERGVRVVDGLLTGWHEPEASHLLLLEAIAGRELLELSYEAAVSEGYLWHEFGDVHLILP